MDKLVESDRSISEGLDAIDQRLRQVREMYRKKNGEDLVMYGEIKRAWDFVERLAQRHLARDYRHTESELTAMKVLAQWTVDVKAIVLGGGCGQTIVWRSGSTRDWKNGQTEAV